MEFFWYVVRTILAVMVISPIGIVLKKQILKKEKT